MRRAGAVLGLLSRRWRRLLVSGVVMFASVTMIIVVQPLWIFRVLAWARPHILWRVDVSQPLVALSFDDGPAPDQTPEVLAILKRHRAHATFFLIGDRAAAWPAFVDRLRSDGHEIGNHGFTLRSVTRGTDQEFVANLLRTEQVLSLRGPVRLFRPPGGRVRASQIALAEQHGYRCVLGSAYPYDPSGPPSSYIRWLVTKNLAPGVIVILHDGIADTSNMLAALDGILADGEQRGFRFVSIGELLAAGERAGLPEERIE
jgi:peptidoglycan-N-acetylglucosamine deacetylase